MKNNPRLRRRLGNAALVLLLGVLVFSSFQVAGILLRQKRAGELKAATRQLYGAEQGAEARYQDSQKNPQQALAASQLRFAKFLEMNPDFVGYLALPGTEIEYPVVQGEDNTYYLYHDFAGQKQADGAIFLDSRNGWDPLDRHLILYGHNMKDNTMFGPLRGYSNQDFWQRSPYIYLDLPQGMTKWEIFSAYTTATDFYYIQTRFDSDAGFQQFLDTLQQKSVIQTGIHPSAGDHLLTLSTCSDSFDDARFVVHARQVRE